MTPELRERIGDRVVIASISGGKDSAAMSLLFHELGIEHRRVFLDTGWEHEATYEYIRGPLTETLGPIEEIAGPETFAELVLRKGMFPARMKRFCTQELKIFPMISYLETLVDEEGIDIVNAVGVRRGESQARSKVAEWEWSDSFDCDIWRPLYLWTEQDVIDIHRRHNLAPNPLYLRGATRVGCWPCIHARKEEIRMVADTDPDRIEEIRRLEAEVAAVALERAAHKGEDRRLPPPTMFQYPVRDADGNRPCRPIDDIVRWSRTARGSDHYAPPAPNTGCMRWGLCE